MSEIENSALGLHGTEHSKCNHLMTLDSKGLLATAKPSSVKPACMHWVVYTNSNYICINQTVGWGGRLPNDPSSYNLHSLEVFPSTAIYHLLRLMAWNLTTRCLAVTDGGSVGECSRLSQSSWVLGALLYYTTLTYLLITNWWPHCKWYKSICLVCHWS